MKDTDVLAAATVLFLVLVVLVAAVFAIAGDGEATCPEYGTVMVTVDDEQRCVPWEQAPDLQDFPEPK